MRVETAVPLDLRVFALARVDRLRGIISRGRCRAPDRQDPGLVFFKRILRQRHPDELSRSSKAGSIGLDFSGVLEYIGGSLGSSKSVSVVAEQGVGVRWFGGRLSDDYRATP